MELKQIEERIEEIKSILENPNTPCMDYIEFEKEMIDLQMLKVEKEIGEKLDSQILKAEKEMNEKVEDFFKKYEKTLIPVLKRLSKK